MAVMSVRVIERWTVRPTAALVKRGRVLLDRGLARPQTSSAAMVYESVVIRIVPYGGRDSGLDTNLILGILPL